MLFILFLALACSVLAAIPVLVHRGRILLNPAFWVLVTVLWGVLAKAAYLAVLRSEPRTGLNDRIWVSATSFSFFERGAMVAVVAVSAYVAGYFLLGGRTLSLPSGFPGVLRRPDRTQLIIAFLLLGCVFGFAIYLYASGTSLLEGPLSAKRFQPREIESSSRFDYLPYYFFKIALLAGPLAYATSFFAARAARSVDRRRFKVLFGVVFAFTLALCHFASLRMVIGLLLLQIALLLYYLRVRELTAFMAAFAVLTVASGATITFVDRAPRSADAIRSTSIETKAPKAQKPSAAPSRARTESDSSPASARDKVDRQPPDSVWRQAISVPLEGRYLLDLTKLAHIARHFPDEAPHLGGGAMVGTVSPAAALVDEGGERMPLDRYLARSVFAEPRNSVPPGFAGELYIGFGFVGVVVGFLTLGLLHRLVFNQLVTGVTRPLFAAAFIVFLLNTTLLLMNSGISPALSRSVLDLAVLAIVCAPALIDAFGRPQEEFDDAGGGPVAGP